MIQITEEKLKAAIQIALASYGVYTDELESTLIHHTKALRMIAPTQKASELEDLSDQLYKSKILHDYKDGKVDYRKVHEFIINITPPVEQSEQVEQKCPCKMPFSQTWCEKHERWT